MTRTFKKPYAIEIIRLFPIVLLALGGFACSENSHPQSKSTPSEQAAPPGTSTKLEVALPADENAALPLDPKIKRGTLPSGLTYFVRENKSPVARGEFWLVVNAGAFLEDDDQLGLAHFVEHMAFNGTTAFPKNQMFSTLQRLGVKLGADINAETNFDETIYKLNVQTDDPQAVDTALQILAEWASQVTFAPEEVEAERGVVLSEKRASLGPEDRIRRAVVHQLLAGTRYESRDVIGEEKILKTASVDTLKRFYRDWYHPQNMAILAVGDFDRTSIEKKILEKMSALKKADKPRAAMTPPSFKLKAQTAITVHDKELPATIVAVGRLDASQKVSSQKDYRRELVSNLAIAMVAHRLEDAQKDGSGRYLLAMGGEENLFRSLKATYFFAAVKPNQVGQGADDLLAQLERVRRFGFVESELARVKKDLLANLESIAKEAASDKTSSDKLVRELVRHFVAEESMPGSAAEYQIAKRHTDEIKLEECAKYIADFLSAKDLVLLSFGADSATTLRSEDFTRRLAVLPDLRLTPFSDQVSDQPLVTDLLPPGTITKEIFHPETEVHEWTLSNGARIFLKPTNFKDDQILLSAEGPGGTITLPPGSLDKTAVAALLVSEGGLGQFDAVALDKQNAGRNVSVSPFIEKYTEGLKASSTTKDLETMLQMVYLSFTAPRFDPKAAQRWIDNKRESVKLDSNNPEIRFGRQLSKLQSNSNPREQIWSEAMLKKMEPKAAFDFYKERFRNANDFAFVLVGSFDPNAVKPLIIKYIASLPSNGKIERLGTDSWPTAGKKQRLVVHDGATPRADLALLFERLVPPGSTSRKQRVAWALWGNALELRLLKVFREDLGETYSVSVNSLWSDNWTRAKAFVAFQCEPQKAEALEARLIAEVDDVVRHGVGGDYLEKARKIAAQKDESDRKNNGYWQRRLIASYLFDLPLTDIMDAKALIESITEKDLAEVAQKYLDVSRPTIGVLLPKGEKPIRNN